MNPIIIWLMITVTLPFAITHMGMYNENYTCANYSIDFVKANDGWNIAVGDLKDESHIWVAIKINNETYWFEPQTGFPVSGPDYKLSWYNPPICCAEFSGRDICPCNGKVQLEL